MQASVATNHQIGSNGSQNNQKKHNDGQNNQNSVQRIHIEKSKGQLNTSSDLIQAIHEGAVTRVRPKVMAVLTTFIGLLPIMWASAHEIGADVAKRIAAPMVGGMVSAVLLTLLVVPAIYFLWRKQSIKKVIEVSEK